MDLAVIAIFSSENKTKISSVQEPIYYHLHFLFTICLLFLVVSFQASWKFGTSLQSMVNSFELFWLGMPSYMEPPAQLNWSPFPVAINNQCVATSQCTDFLLTDIFYLRV